MDPVPPATARRPSAPRRGRGPSSPRPLRGGAPAATPPLERWEEVLRHETSSATARPRGSRGCRCWAPATSRRRRRSPPTLAEREALVARVRATPHLPAPGGAALGAPVPAPVAAPRGGRPLAAETPTAPAPPRRRRRRRTADVAAHRRRHRRAAHGHRSRRSSAAAGTSSRTTSTGRSTTSTSSRPTGALARARTPPGIDWDLDAQLAVAAEMDGYRHELADVPREPRPGASSSVWENNAFGGADAVVYYGMVRSLRPRRVVEVGAGGRACSWRARWRVNDEPCAVTLVEPEPNPELFAVLPEELGRAPLHRPARRPRALREPAGRRPVPVRRLALRAHGQRRQLVLLRGPAAGSRSRRRGGDPRRALPRGLPRALGLRRGPELERAVPRCRRS